MKSITVHQPIPVKVIVTPEFRDRIISEARESIEEIELNLERLASTLPESADGERTEDFEYQRNRVEGERHRLYHAKSELEWRIREAESIKDGAELPFQTVHGVIELCLGDDYLARTQPEIVLKDWKVVEIRQV